MHTHLISVNLPDIILYKIMIQSPVLRKAIILFHTLAFICCNCLAEDTLFRQARELQHDGEYDQAIEAFQNILTQQVGKAPLTDQQMFIYTESLVQLMNTFQSKGEPEACISALNKLFDSSVVLQKQFSGVGLVLKDLANAGFAPIITKPRGDAVCVQSLGNGRHSRSSKVFRKYPADNFCFCWLND